MRAIEKTVSSLIPPTATFRLPAARWRIGSRETAGREKGKRVIDEECESAEEGQEALNNHMRYSSRYPPPVQIRLQFQLPPPERIRPIYSYF